MGTLAYTVADIIKATGAKRRTVQFWADREIIRATKATQEGGPGVHRSFTRDELIIACLIHPLSLGWREDQTRSVGELIQVASSIRMQLKHDFSREDFERAIAGDGKFYLVITWLFGARSPPEYWVAEVPPKGQLFFPAAMATLEQHPGRCEVLYLNDWLRLLRNM
jgi:hypothetical protein